MKRFDRKKLYNIRFILVQNRVFTFLVALRVSLEVVCLFTRNLKQKTLGLRLSLDLTRKVKQKTLGLRISLDLTLKVKQKTLGLRISLDLTLKFTQNWSFTQKILRRSEVYAEDLTQKFDSVFL